MKAKKHAGGRPKLEPGTTTNYLNLGKIAVTAFQAEAFKKLAAELGGAPAAVRWLIEQAFSPRRRATDLKDGDPGPGI